jgi:photosystem II stability/assembly factor-like uncharacterized protein
VGVPINSLAVDPVDPAVAYAATDGFGIFKTNDGGETWTRRSQGLAPTVMYTVVVNPDDPDVVYAGGGGPAGEILFKSTNGAKTWVNITDKMGSAIRSIALSPDDPETLFVGVFYHLRIYKSLDGGVTWAPSGAGIPKETIVQALAVDPLDPAVVYAGLGLAPNSSLYRSTDGGESWSPSGAGLVTSDVNDIVVDPLHPGVVYVTAIFDGLFKSTDGGATWFHLDAGPTGATTLEMDPNDPATIYTSRKAGLAGENLGVFKSTDAGVTWKQYLEGMTGGVVDAVAFDPTNPDIVYAGFQSQDPRIYKSVDGGLHWVPYRMGIPGPVIFTDLAIDPAHPNTLYATSQGPGGLLKSTNAGRSWRVSNVGLPGGSPWDVAIDPTDSSHLIVADEGVYESSDSGATWHVLGDRDLFVSSVTFDPNDPEIIYAGIGGNDFEGGGLHKTTDGGSTWRSILHLRQDETVPWDIEIDPADSTRVYLALSAQYPVDGLVLTSNDGGTTWIQAGANFPGWVWDVAVLAGDHTSWVFAATNAGVYRSADLGMHWSPFNDGLVSGFVNAIVLTENGSRAYTAVGGGGVARMNSPGG